ncbi:MAG: M20/M25/M40 family metallo-hydrolase [Deinococcales bacterium]
MSLSKSSAQPYLIPADHPYNQKAAKVLKEFYGQDPYYVRMGGSVPICGIFLRALGVYTVSFGFAIEDEGFHAPNEFFRLSSFNKGQRAYGLLLEELAHEPL